MVKNPLARRMQVMGEAARPVVPKYRVSLAAGKLERLLAVFLRYYGGPLSRRRERGLLNVALGTHSGLTA